MKYNLVHADTCLSDYWGGHHLPHVAVPVDGTPTVKEVLDGVRSELNQGAVAGSLSWEVIESEEFYNACVKALQKMVELNADNLNKVAFPDLEVFQEEDDEGPYVLAFFVFVPVEEDDED